MRYSILYGFNTAKATDLYKRYLHQVVVPKIPADSRVVIHGYTDKIGDDDYNLQLSMERSNDVYAILKSEVTRTGKKNVEFTVIGFGEDVALVPFENETPEERFYNRTVIVDIIPQEKK
jgi:outer membrane protein OmpA-like peptidoglycan-associated protein